MTATTESDQAEQSPDYKRGWDAALEDYAIGASFDYPDPTLSEDYRKGYVDGWNQCNHMAAAFELDVDTDGDTEVKTAEPRVCCDNVYWCPEGKEIECPQHGGFDVCCEHPESHKAPEAALQEYAQEIEGYHQLVGRQGDLLTGVVKAIRGEPPKLTWWSHHDAPVLAQKAMARVAELEKAIDALTHNTVSRGQLRKLQEVRMRNWRQELDDDHG